MKLSLLLITPAITSLFLSSACIDVGGIVDSMDTSTDTDIEGDTDSDADADSDTGWDTDSYVNSKVLPTDTVLVPPDNRGPIIAPITAYTWRKEKTWPDEYYELPIYKTAILDRETDAYWNYLVDELLLARVDVVLLHGRGCHDPDSGLDGNGSLCPRWLTRFHDAVKRADAENVLKIGMFDPMDHYSSDVDADQFDMSDESNWKYFWSYNVEILFDIFPQNMWFLMDGKPIYSTWHLGDNFFINQQGNASRLLSWLKNRFEDKYGREPAFVIQDKWFDADSTINLNHADGKHSWFSPRSGALHSYTSFNEKKWGVVGPGYRKIQGGDDNGGNSLPGCGEVCREVLRRNGQTAIEGFEKGKDAHLILLEGWTNISENNGFYRSNDWQYPNHYINIVRHYADPEPETLRFQAEAADSFSDKTDGNSGNTYRNGDLDIGELGDRSGWYVGWTDAGEWLEFKEVELGCGTYRFTARAATDSKNERIRLEIGGLPGVNVQDTGGMNSYELVHLGEVKLPAGKYNLRVVFETGNINLDWFFVKRSSTNCGQ